jgi:hypothetical protein
MMIKRRRNSKIRNEHISNRSIRPRRLREEYLDYDNSKSEITNELEGWGFEYVDDGYWEFYLPYEFKAIYNSRYNEGYIELMETEIPGFTKSIKTARDADEFGRIVYNMANYDMTKLLVSLMKEIGAKEIGRFVYEYNDKYGERAIIDLNNEEADITYRDGDTEHFYNLGDAWHEIGLVW